MPAGLAAGRDAASPGSVVRTALRAVMFFLFSLEYDAMYTLSLDDAYVQRMVEREDDTINDPLALLIQAEEELEFNAAAVPAPIGQHHKVEKSS